LEALDAEESWTEEERHSQSAHIEEGFLQAERGELTEDDRARREIQGMKARWLRERSA
jgi:predicted transcriptional regulator